MCWLFHISDNSVRSKHESPQLSPHASQKESPQESPNNSANRDLKLDKLDTFFIVDENKKNQSHASNLEDLKPEHFEESSK